MRLFLCLMIFFTACREADFFVDETKRRINTVVPAQSNVKTVRVESNLKRLKSIIEGEIAKDPSKWNLVEARTSPADTLLLWYRFGKANFILTAKAHQSQQVANAELKKYIDMLEPPLKDFSASISPGATGAFNNFYGTDMITFAKRDLAIQINADFELGERFAKLIVQSMP